jgi:uncharacterized protein
MHLHADFQCQRIAPRFAAKVIVTFALSIALVVPASAQFWNWGGFGDQRRQQYQRQHRPPPQSYNPFRNWFGTAPSRPERPPVVDFSHAPPPPHKPAGAVSEVTTPILVLGDAMADWLAYGLEDAFSEKPEFGVVRKHRTYSGLIRYDARQDTTWAKVARQIIAEEKPKFIIMMIGVHDRQTIRETPAVPAKNASAQPAVEETGDPNSPESRARESAKQQNAELQRRAKVAAATPEQRQEPATGPMEFHSDRWQAAYIKRIDRTIAALKSGGVPVFWVGLPPQRNTRISSDWAYLNELFRARAERAGIVYVDVWDGFVDEAGRYSYQGPDYEGQIRRLRSGDGVYFTKAGARKLAHYVEREIQRSIVNQAVPVSLPTTVPVVLSRGRGERPLAGPVYPLTVPYAVGNELLGGGTARPVVVDPIANRVLVHGEPIAAPTGRADNFAWPQGGAKTATTIPAGAASTVAPPVQPNTDHLAPPSSAKQATGKQGTGKQPAVKKSAKREVQPHVAKPPVHRRPRPRNSEAPPRPPLAIVPR